MRVLLVEDNVLILTSDALKVEDLGHEVIQAMSGSEACKLLEEGRSGIDAIITDMQMPEGTGLSLIEYLNAHSLTIPTLLHSACDFYCVDGEEIPLQEAVRPFSFAWYCSKAAQNHIEQFLRFLAIPLSVAAQ